MNDVFLKTRELGEALLHSDEYKAVKQAEDRAMANQEASEAVGRYLELRGKMEEMMSAQTKDWDEVRRVTEEIDECKQKMDAIDDLNTLNEARDRFSELINQINSVLRFIVTGEMSADEGGCSGSCSTCGGCTGRVS